MATEVPPLSAPAEPDAPADDTASLDRHARSDAPRLAADARAAFEADRMGPGKAKAYLDSLAAVRDAADTDHRLAKLAASSAETLAVRQAGDDRVNRERARAFAIGQHAESLGATEAALEVAAMAHDRAAVEVAAFCLRAGASADAAKLNMAEYESARDHILYKSNPFADPVRPTILRSQYDAIKDPALRERAGREANIVDDPQVTFGLDDARNVLRSVGSAARVVLPRSAFDAMNPVDQARAAKTAIIIDDDD